jgi:hypothetical protein
MNYKHTLHQLVMATVLAGGLSLAWYVLGIWILGAMPATYAAGELEVLQFLPDRTPVVSNRGGELRDLAGERSHQQN